MLRGASGITLRVVSDARDFELDLADTMRVERVTVDGHRSSFEPRGARLIIKRRVDVGERHRVRVLYAGTPEPVRGPASRPDIARLGMRVTESG